MANNDDLSPEEIEFRDQIAEETTPESMTRALRRRASMLSSPSTRERQRQLDLDRHRQTVSDIDARYGRAVTGNPLPTDDMSPDALKRDQDIRRHNITKANEMQNEFSAGGYWENYRKERAAADLIKSTGTFVGSRSTSEQISHAARSVSSLGAITTAAGGRTSTQLERDVTAERGRLAGQQEEIRSLAATGINTPAEEEAYRQAGIHHQESINKLGVLTGAQTRQSRGKTDLTGRQRSIENLVAQVGKDSLKRQVASDIVSGNVGSMQEETLNLESMQSKIQEAADAFSKALDGSGESAEELGKDLAKLGDDYVRQKEKMSQMSGGGSNTGVARWSGTAADAVQAISVGVQTMGVDQELRDMANRTGFAAISNQQFQDHQSALSGDMAAFRRMSTNQYGKAANKAGFMGALTTAAVTGGGAADSLAIVSKLAEKGFNLTSLTSMGSAANESASIIAQRGVSGVSKVVDAYRGISSGETRRQTYQAAMGLSDEEMRVQDISAQAYRDTMGSNTLASRGAGSGRGALFGQMNDPGQRAALAALGMGAEQMQSMYGQGVSEMGADFRGTAAGDMAKRAAELQKSGLMGAGEYMSSMGQLNAVGGAGNMETIMKNAVANGMDSSRNIQQMVAGISNLSGESAMMGISTAAGATNAMGLALGTSALRSLPAEMRVAAATNQIGKMNNSMSDSSMNLFNVAESFALRKAAPGVSDAQIIRMQTLNATELSEIQNDPSAAKKFGLGFLSDKKLLKTVSGIITGAESNKQGGLILSKKARAAMNDPERSRMTQEEFEAKYPEESQEILAAKGGRGLNAAITDSFLAKLGAGESSRGMFGPERPIGKDGTNIGSGSDKTNAAEDILAKQFQSMEEINTRGQEIFESMYKGIEGFNDRLNVLLKDFDVDEYQEQASKAAGSSSMQVKGFDGSVSNFSKAVDKFVAKVTGEVKNKGESSSDNMKNKRVDFSGGMSGRYSGGN